MEQFQLDSIAIQKNIDSIVNVVKEEKLGALYISSNDPFLSEYVPLDGCQRYYVSSFTGSTAEVLVLEDGVYLFVDGRYHEQADSENSKFVNVVKVDFGSSLLDSMVDLLKERGVKSLSLISERTALKHQRIFAKDFELSNFSQDHFETLVNYKEKLNLKEVFWLSKELTGLNTAEKLDLIFKDLSSSCYFISALDSISWLTNGRGFHAPYQSYFFAKAFVTQDKVYLFSYDELTYSKEFSMVKEIETYPFSKMEQIISEIVRSKKIETINIQSSAITVSDSDIIFPLFSEESRNEASLTAFHTIKNSTELEQMKSAFNRSNQAIVKTLRWLRKSVGNEKISELDFYNKTNEYYKNEGAVDQSFQTISAVDENSSIIHFSSPSSNKMITKDSMVLLDTGAHYEAGFATDTTRTIFVGENPTAKHIEIYTLVLKGILQAEMTPFPEGTTGASIDAFARQSMWRYGYNYQHGTGHGVGINVHEGEFSISTRSKKPLLEGMVGSIEPGIYVPNFGGVRLENIAVIKKHSEFEGYLCFEPLTYIGYDHRLIDFSLLTRDEAEYLKSYEKECSKRKTLLEE